MMITIQNHQETLIFDIVKIIIHNIILKMPWLKLHNSDISWKKKYSHLRNATAWLISSLRIDNDRWWMRNKQYRINYNIRQKRLI